MKIAWKIGSILLVLTLALACNKKGNNIKEQTKKHVVAKDILGNPNYLAISYGGYRAKSRDTQPTIAQLKEDLKIMAAMDIKTIRTYNVHLPHAENILEAIHQLKQEDNSFEMYVMLGAWINCKDAFTSNPNHDYEDAEGNEKEIDRAVELAQQYPDIVKIIAVGNEAMVKWATSYFVQPWVILKYVNHLQELKRDGVLSKDLWITSSDNFASWGGGEDQYHVEDLEKLIAAVDYVSLHTYPMHDTHYNPKFWGVLENEENLNGLEKIDVAMERARDYAVSQFESTKEYITSLDIEKPIHIGETGWASYSNGHYGQEGSQATDEYKEALYFKLIKEWSHQNGVSCFYFEAFDEIWKDAQNAGGSENHFGLFTLDGKAKYALWDLVDKGVFEGLTRNGNKIEKTYKGDKEALLIDVALPPTKGALVTAE